ncbi:MAG: D-cysteine desulfhydrase [Dongiaceae bacterium]
MLARFPRRRFCHLPTPLEELPALSRHLGGPTLLAKRDDCTGLALGGNKNRKLEFILAEALAAGADTLVTAGGVQSNHCRQTAAAAARHGLACELVLSRSVPSNDPAYPRSGNVLLDRLFGARLNYVGADIDWAVELEAVAEQVRRRGGRPHIVPVGGSTPTGALGYVACGQEILQQAEAAGRPIDAVVHCSGSGGAQAGLLVGLQGSGVPVIGVSSGRARATLTGQVLELADQTLAKLGRRGTFPRDEVEVLDAYVGAGYGMPTPGMLEALELCARLEGLLLDPVYTGKAMAGLIDLIRQGRFGAGQTVVFVHTGGVPALFAYQDAVMPD